MKQLPSPKGIAPRNDSSVYTFEGEIKSPGHKLFDAGKAVLAKYQKYEERVSHVSMPIPVFFFWSIGLLIAGAIFALSTVKLF